MENITKLTFEGNRLLFQSNNIATNLNIFRILPNSFSELLGAYRYLVGNEILDSGQFREIYSHGKGFYIVSGSNSIGELDTFDIDPIIISHNWNGEHGLRYIIIDRQTVVYDENIGIANIEDVVEDVFGCYIYSAESVYSEYHEGYIHEDDSDVAEVLINGCVETTYVLSSEIRNSMYFHEIAGRYYHENTFDRLDIVWDEYQEEYNFAENLYWDECAGCYTSCLPDYDDEYDVDFMFRYHSGPEPEFFDDESDLYHTIRVNIGFEIEKSNLPHYSIRENKYKFHQRTGCKIESDSSVDDGFELITAVYQLYSSKTDERLKAIQPLCDVEGIENAGGHINLSSPDMDGRELIRGIEGILPLLLGMHYHRKNNTYCSFTKYGDMLTNTHKYSPIVHHSNRVELRFFSGVKSFDTLKFRLNLLRYSFRNIGKKFDEVLKELYIDSELRKIVSQVYGNDDKLNQLVKNSLSIYSEYFHNRSTPQYSELVNSLNSVDGLREILNEF